MKIWSTFVDLPYNVLVSGKGQIQTFADLFCGIGGFHQAAEENGLRCVFASDIDKNAREAYRCNYGVLPVGDIQKERAEDIPPHDLLCAGFPCQPFSIIGKRMGFDDMRGTLFFDIVRILQAKRPRTAILENVRQLVTHNGGATLSRIIDALGQIGYHAEYRVLNALDFGLPQKRERVIITAFRSQVALGFFQWPIGDGAKTPLSKVLERDEYIDPKHFVSKRIRDKRAKDHKSKHKPAIWHENKGGNISSHPFSCALRAGASYNYLLVDGKRRLTPREMLRLQGFSDSFKIVCNDGQTRKQAGNAVPVPVVSQVIKEMLNAAKKAEAARAKAVA